jgi:addiction module RelE/StbE family toxin
MEIHFRTKKLEKILSDDRLIKKHYSKIFNGLTNRLSELKAVGNLSLISHNPPPRKHKLSGEYEGYWSVDVSKNYRLLFTVPNKNIINENQINEIVIEEIVDTH